MKRLSLETLVFVFLVLLFLFLSVLIILPPAAEAQSTFTYTPRPVAQFQPGQERECELHWLRDLTILREWQQEYQYWRGRHNLIAELLGLGVEYNKGNPTLNKYDVSENLIQEELDAGLYPSFIAACNSHIIAAHNTETDFAYAVDLIRQHCCAARQTAFGVLCDHRRFGARFPLQIK